MTKKFSIILLSEGDAPKILHETHSHYEAKNKFQRIELNVGQQVTLRSHLNGEAKVIGIRDNQYCA